MCARWMKKLSSLVDIRWPCECETGYQFGAISIGEKTLWPIYHRDSGDLNMLEGKEALQ